MILSSGSIEWRTSLNWCAGFTSPSPEAIRSVSFRPGCSCHDALRAVGESVDRCGTEYIVEADIKGFFDNDEHDQLICC